MPDGVGSTIYAIDTNVLMDWQARHYPTDVFASLVDRVTALITAGRWQAPALVLEEVGAVGTDDLKHWAKAHKAMFLPTKATTRKSSPGSAGGPPATTPRCGRVARVPSRTRIASTPGATP